MEEEVQDSNQELYFATFLLFLYYLVLSVSSHLYEIWNNNNYE